MSEGPERIERVGGTRPVRPPVKIQRRRRDDRENQPEQGQRRSAPREDEPEDDGFPHVDVLA